MMLCYALARVSRKSALALLCLLASGVAVALLRVVIMRLILRDMLRRYAVDTS